MIRHEAARPSVLPKPAIAPSPFKYIPAAVLSALLIGLLYLWCVQAANGPFPWRGQNAGFYNLLAHGFAGGHLYVPIDPAKELLALPDPLDPTRNGQYGIQDMALYNKRYYVYHGAAPVVMLFLPWLVVSGRDVPESFAGFLFCFLGYLCWSALFLKFLSRMDSRPSVFVVAVLLAALGICQSVPFLLQRVQVYEVAIAAGYFTVAAGFLLFAVSLWKTRASLAGLALSGLMLGLAIGCRPHLAFAGLFACVLMLYMRLRRSAIGTREMAAFSIPYLACALAIGLYNYARFHDPLEFGFRYELASPAYFRPLLSFANFRVGFYYLFVCPPDLDPVFPFFRLIMRAPFELPKRYFLEPIAGMLVVSPLAACAVVLPPLLKRKGDRFVRFLAGAICLSDLAALGVVACLGLISQRFEVDFLPSFVLAGCLAISLVEGAPGAISGFKRRIARAALWGALIYSVAAGLALGVQGPYDEFVQKHPAAYVNLARWFSPLRLYRPIENPKLRVEATYEFPAAMGSAEMPLIAAGRFGTRYLLTAAPLGGNRVRLNAATTFGAGIVASADVPVLAGAANAVRLEYHPERAEMTIDWNGATVIRHPLSTFITAPSQVTFGEDHTGLDTWPGHFTGRVVMKSVWIDSVEYR